MNYTRKIWEDRIVQYPNRYRDQNDNLLILTPEPGEVAKAGTVVNAEAMNHIEDGIEGLSDVISGEDSVIVRVKQEGQTSLCDSNSNTLDPVIPHLEQMFKFQSIQKEVSVVANGATAIMIGSLDIPSGYVFLGILPKRTGYSDQWQVSFGLYSDNKVYAFLKNYYADSLSSVIGCSIIYVKQEYYEQGCA